MELVATIGGAGAGGTLVYVLLANRRIKGYQSKARWIPALIAGGRIKELALVLVVVALGAAVGAVFGAGLYGALDAQAR